MGKANPLGQRYDVDPIAPVPEATTYVPAGPLAIGVEFRRLTDDVVNETFDADTQKASGIDVARPTAGLDEKGVSLHVCDAETLAEYVRFDNFEDDPHYHYIVPGSHNIVIPFDPTASGDFMQWAFERIRTRLPDMVREAGAVELADRIDAAAIEAAMPQVVELVDEAMRVSAAR